MQLPISFEAWRTAGRDVEDLESDDEVVAFYTIAEPDASGRIYPGGLVIERSDTGWYLCVGNQEYETGDLQSLEAILYTFAANQELLAPVSAEPSQPTAQPEKYD